MKIRIETYEGHEDIEVKDYIINCLNGDDYDRGAMEATRKTADNACEAIGKLINILTDKGLLNATEIKDIAGDFMSDSIALVK